MDQPAGWEELPGGFEPGATPPADAPELDKAPPPSRWRKWKRVALILLGLFLLLFAWLAVTAPLSKSLQPIAAPSLTLLSAEGDEIARRGANIAAPVRIEALPSHVPAAFVSIEDRGFENHLGISVRGITRAAWRNLVAGQVREGGSTITQQLAKVSFLSSDRTAARKLQEVLIAFWLEAWLEKDEILERYLSNVYFGDNVYGLRAAAHHYFSVAPEDLTVSQAAMLAGMVKAPSRLAPTKNLKGARARAKVVVGTMVRDGVLTEREAKRLRPARLRVAKTRAIPTGTYFADWIMPQARLTAGEGYGEQRVQTTLETRLQSLALRTVNRAGLGAAEVGLVAMRPDGRVVAMVGGKSYARSPFNRATQARRQPGSTFKLFVYLAALRAGMSPESTIEDRPITIGTWTPKNNDGRYRGRITLREAFAISSNVAAVRLSERVGRENVIRAARDLGITSPLADSPSLALGTSGVTLLEMTSAYAAIAAGSYPVRPIGIAEAPQPWWRRAWTSMTGSSRDYAFPKLAELLFASANEGTGRAAALQVPTFGKTGTTQDNRDAIFIGFTEDLVVGVWVGKDDNSPLGKVAGGGLPARIWRDFMVGAVGSQAAKAAVRQVAAPAQSPLSGTRISVPIDGAGVRVELNDNGMEILSEEITEVDEGEEEAPAPAGERPAPSPAPPPGTDVEEEVEEELG